MPDHTGDGQAVCRDFAVVILPVGEVRVGQDGVSAHGVERDGLGPEMCRRGDGEGRIHHLGIGDRPLQDLHPPYGAADHGQQVPDAQLVEQQLLDLDHVGDGDDGENQAVGFAGLGIRRGRPRRARAAAEKVRADDEVLVRIDALARPDHDLPPAGLSVVRMIIPGDVGVAAQGMADQNRIVPGLVKLPIRLIGDVNRPERLAAFQQQRLILFDEPNEPGLDQAHRILIITRHDGNSIKENPLL